MPYTGDELAALYRDQIQAGELPPDAKLPSLSELQRLHDVGKGVAQVAIAKLRAEGLIESRHGSGNYVKAPAPKVVMNNNWADAIQGGSDPERSAQVLRIDEISVPPFAQEDFNLQEGDPVVLRHARVDYLGQPAHLEWVCYPVELARGTAIVYHDPGEGGVYARLAEQGLVVDRFVERVATRLPAVNEIEILRIRGDAPVLEVTRTAWAGDRVVEVGRAVLNGDLYQVVHETVVRGGTR